MPESPPDYAVSAWWTRRWEKVDPESGQRRFYIAELRQDLWGDWLLVKAWGRIGQKPSRVVIVPVNTPEEALELAEHIENTRKKHQYIRLDDSTK